ncbi:MAG: hypothetical protein ACI8R0_001712 [Alteromonadales bacterium]|jgi:hypothetical protein
MKLRRSVLAKSVNVIIIRRSFRFAELVIGEALILGE